MTAIAIETKNAPFDTEDEQLLEVTPVSTITKEETLQLKKTSSDDSNNSNSSNVVLNDERSNMLHSMLTNKDVYLGGAAMGKGFTRAARYFLHQKKERYMDEFDNEETESLFDSSTCSAMVNAEEIAAEDSFYVVDIGIIISQYYQWRKAFPRVEPFYAVKCNPDPTIVRTLAILGANFDCASRAEIRLVKDVSKDLKRQPEIVYANPCKARGHLMEALRNGVTMVTFDNPSEVIKCASISKKVQLIMRIVTDDRGSACRLSSKFGAPKHLWRPNLREAKRCGLDVVGVSFHVGSGCRDASRYELALKDAKYIMDIAKNEFGFENMNLLDIGGGFPGETHSTWNPAHHLGDNTPMTDEDNKEDDDDDDEDDENNNDDEPLLFFEDIAAKVRPMIDELFPVGCGVRIIAEPGRYFVAASATLVASITSARNNLIKDGSITEASCTANNATASSCSGAICSNKNNAEVEELTPFNNAEASLCLDQLTREEERNLVQTPQRRQTSIGNATFSKADSKRNLSFDLFANADMNADASALLNAIGEEMAEYAKMLTIQSLAQQEADIYNDALDLAKDGFDTATDLLGPPEITTTKTFDGSDDLNGHDSVVVTDPKLHSVEGMNAALVNAVIEGGEDDVNATTNTTTNHNAAGNNINTMEDDLAIVAAAGGEAVLQGVVMQAVADHATATVQDDFAYYINDGVYGAFNNIMFDHAVIRPRQLKNPFGSANSSSTRRSEILVDESPDAAAAAPEPNHVDGCGHRQTSASSSSQLLYASTVFGPTCDSIDVVARSVLLPQLNVGDWLYFQNMGAYTNAAASSFNGFSPSERFYVCSVLPQYFDKIIAGPSSKAN